MKKILIFFIAFITTSVVFGQQPDRIYGDIIVQLKPSQSIRQIVGKLSKYNGIDTDIQIVKNASPPLRIWLLHFDHTKINEREFLNHVRNLPEVEIAQFNRKVSMRETIPDDPNFTAQWQWVNNGQGGGTPDADVDADLAWDITTGGSTATGHEIVVCVVEGTNRSHPDLQGNLWVNNAEIPGNGIDDDNNGYVDDYNGWNINNDTDQIPAEQHGTQVSGMIGAKGNNSLFTTGINWDVKIMNVEFSGITESNVIESYTYPLVQRRIWNQSGGTQGAFVVATNSSWGIDGGDPADSPLWCAFYDSLGVEGILSCGATANNNVNIDQVLDLPTACTSEYMVAVTATNNNDLRTFSGYGTTHIDVAAPGGGIVTISTNGGPSTTSGTSFASPLTAGIIALLYSAPCSNIGELALADPSAAAFLIRDALFAGVDVIPNLVNETKYGGRVNAFNSLNIILQNCGPCPKPYSVQVSNILDVSADINWQSPDSSLTTDLRYRQLGDTVWTYQQAVTSPFSLTGLLACTEYEFQLEEICASDSSGYANSIVFKTEGCCVAPSELSVSDITMNAATLSWTPVFAANFYNVRINSSFGEVIVTDLLEPTFELVLMPCTEYTVQVQTACDTGLTDFTLPISFTTLGCGACQDLTYCPSAAQSTQYEWIENVSLANINNTSGNNNGYGDFTGVSTDLATFTSNTISVTPGFAGGTYPEWIVAYLDFNQDGDFNDPGEKVFDTGTTFNTTVTGEIIIPGTATLGITRLRVIMRWNASPAGPCAASFNNGEVEDYCVNIVAGTPPNCLVPTDLTVVDSTMTTAALSWTAVPDAIGYTVQHRKVGITGWTTTQAATNSLEISPLEVCKDYEVHVRSNCTGTASDYSSSVFFKTVCVSSTDDAVAEQVELTAVPNPFSDELMLKFRLGTAQLVNFEIADVCGRTVFEKQQFFASGSNQVTFSPNLVTGVYFVKMQVNNGLAVMKVVKE